MIDCIDTMKIRLLEEFYDCALLKELYIVFQHILLPPSTFFVANSLVESGEVASSLNAYFPHSLCVFIEHHLSTLASVIKVEKKSEGGWEIWSRVCGPDSPSFGYLHIDNDEYLRSKREVLKTPLYGTILYVGQPDNIKGGETAFLTSDDGDLEQKIFSKLRREEFASPAFQLVSPYVGRLVVFQGSIPHAVMWARVKGGGPRVTLLANYWGERLSSVPGGVCAMTPAEYKGKDVVGHY